VTTTLIAAHSDHLRALLPWAQAVAIGTQTDLTVVLPQRKKGSTRLVALPDDAAEDETDLVGLCRQVLKPSDSSEHADEETDSAAAPDAHLYQLIGDDWAAVLSTHLEAIGPSVVIVPAPTISKEQAESDDWQTVLLANTSCEVILIQDDSIAFEREMRLAVVLQNGFDNECALHRAAQMAPPDGTVQTTVVYIEPNVGDLSVSVGMQQLSRLLRETLNHYERDTLERRVIVSGSFSEAIRQLDANDFDMVLTGTASLSVMRRFFAAGAGSTDSDMIPAFAVVRPAESLSNRLWGRLDRWIRSTVPQLAREERVDLVTRIQTSSQWDFDFILLISLATLIACLGLAEDSGAVIVGAMLVAPLMTPIAGVGLGVAHSNSFLTRVALRTALRGFATAMLIAVLFGLCVQVISWTGWLAPLQSTGMYPAEYPAEMESRTHPQVYDLLIALASGMAAAYAMGRPNLFSALPGVAIAAALVPPIATSGIALAHGDLVKGGGALLLFVTNIVTIILGTALVFRAVGVRSQKEGQAAAKWPRYSLLLLVALSILVTVMMALFRETQG
jgi:uncharacterized hydrophobic protein (TIGR00271 family)